MQGMNKFFLLGFLGQEPESRVSTGGRPYTLLNVATHRRTFSNEGEEPELKTQWFQVCVWGKQAENCSRYLSKGQGVMVEASLSPYSQQAKEGQNRSGIAINASYVQFLPRTKAAEIRDHRPSS